MKKIFLFSLLISSLILSQENTDLIKPTPYLTPLEEIQIKFDDFDLYLELNSFKNNFPLNNDPNTIRLWTSAALSNSNNFIEEEPSLYFTSYQYQQHLENSKFNPFKYVLGMAQAGAVGYLAYKHIKKYGLFK